jgi:amidase
MKTGELWRMSAHELAAMISSKRASSQEVVEAHLARIEAVNPSINAVTIVLDERAIATAKAADRATASGAHLPPFHGVPFTIKASIDVDGMATSMGLKILARALPSRDAPSVERLRAAGAIPLGRTNCPSLTVRWHTNSELWGPTINPWDPSITPGGSSGGEAAALATGMSPLGLGSDGLGSLRWPAQCCGVSALKPTLGRIPHATTIEPADGAIGLQLTSVVGPMGRRIADLRAALEVMAGPTWRDPWTVPAPLVGPEPARPVRVALVVDPGGHGTARQVQEGAWKAGQTLEEAGYLVEEVAPPSIDVAAKTLLAMLNTPDIRASWQLMSPVLPADTREFLSAFYELAGDPDPETTLQSFVTRQSVLRTWAEFQETHPLIIAPIFTDIPFQAGTDLDDGRVAETIRGMRMTLAVNALGLPAVALPVGIEGGLPQSMQVIGPRFREDLCLEAAAALEDRVGIITPIDPVGAVAGARPGAEDGVERNQA